jgi:hypothetical protein
MGDGTLRALKAAVVVMGVLIIGGTGLLGVLIARRMSGAAHVGASSKSAAAPGPAAAGAAVPDALLDEPSGTRVAGTSLAGDRMALALQGGGPDRVVVLDLRSGRVIARVGLRP